MRLFMLVGVVALHHHIQERGCHIRHHRRILYQHPYSGWLNGKDDDSVEGCHVTIVASYHLSMSRRMSAVNMLATKRRREWKIIRVVADLLCMVPRRLHWTCSLVSGHWYVWVISSCTSIYVQQLHFLKFPQWLYHFIPQTYMNSRKIYSLEHDWYLECSCIFY